MRLAQTLLLVLIFPAFLYAEDFYKQGHFVVKGQVNNPKGDFIDVRLSSYFGDEAISIKIRPDGSFEQSIPIQNRQFFYLNLDSESFQFHVKNKDTLYLSWSDADLKNSFSIQGKNKFRTNELQLEAKLHSKSFGEYFVLLKEIKNNPKKLSAVQLYEKINMAYSQHVQAIADSVSSYPVDSSSSEIDNLIIGLFFQYSYLLTVNNLLPAFNLDHSFLKSKWNRLKEISPFLMRPEQLQSYHLMNEDWFWHVPEYRHFIDSYINSISPFNQFDGSSNASYKEANQVLDKYYLAHAYLKINSIKDWFITKYIIVGFNYLPFADVEKVYQIFINNCTVHYFKDTVQKYYTAIKRLKPGNPAPGFSLKNEKGQMVSLSNFKGKVVYIDFWGTNCGPCIGDIKNHVPDLHKRYKDKEVVFINICVDAKENEWKEALVKYQLGGINLIAEGWTSNPVCKAYYVNPIPHYILIDKNGKLANSNAPRASQLNAIRTNNPIDVLLK